MPGTNWRTLCFLFAAPGLLAQDPVATGIDQFHRGDYQGAKVTLEQAVKRKPRDEHARTFLALSRAATGGCDAAANDLLEVFSGTRDPELKRLSGLALVQCDLAASRFGAALPMALELEREFPADADVLYESARLYMKAWNDVVFRMFQKTPASYRVNQVSAEIFEVQGRYAEAVAEYRKAIEKNPAAVNLHFRLGRALLMQSHSAQAVAQARHEFEAELKLNPNDAVAEYEIGQILVTERKPDEAAPRFERALGITPDFAEALVALARLRLDRKRYDDAIQLLQHAVRLQPANESAHYNLMLAYRNAGRSADAQREKAEIEKLQRPPEGEFTEFLKKLGEKSPNQ
ncbi:MAG TPA: tetratricopeptide repeat protein [Bryobacteraceae bacterium]|nr:tetratricopeptide repeat protein [Bryobacteraceae bacterium]